MKIGDVCVKVAGRDAGKVCVVLDVLDNNRVLVDGESRRRKVNPSHLVLLGKQAKVEKGASHEKVLEAIKGAKDIELAKILEKKEVVKVAEHKPIIKEDKSLKEALEEVQPAEERAGKKGALEKRVLKKIEEAKGKSEERAVKKKMPKK